MLNKMGKMKELMIDEMNNQMFPPPDMIDTDSGKSMWEIKGYRIWAETYQQALELLPMIESF